MGKYIGVIIILFTFQAFAIGNNNSQAQFRSQNPSKLQISTLNLKWFGSAGNMNKYIDDIFEKEFRHENIKKFIEQELGTSDVITFTEVVDTASLINLVSDKFNCDTYQGSWDRHQHVMICHKKNRFRTEKYDNDNIIENVDLGSGGQRPAVQVKLCYKTGRCFLQVIGIHLAAGNKTEKRSEQVKVINEDLTRQNNILPTVVTGDFNSYFKERSGGTEDDITIFERILSTSTKTFKSVTAHITTYNSGEYASTLDHIVTTTDIKTLSTWGYETCKKQPDFKKQFIPYSSYRKYFTDHCPVTAEVVIK